MSRVDVRLPATCLSSSLLVGPLWLAASVSKEDLAALTVLGALGAVPLCFAVLALWVMPGVDRAKMAPMQLGAITKGVRDAMAGMPKTSSIGQAEVDRILASARGDPGLLLRDKAGRFVDVWGRPIHVELRQIGDAVVIEVLATGYDGVVGTWDDLWTHMVWRSELGVYRWDGGCRATSAQLSLATGIARWDSYGNYLDPLTDPPTDRVRPSSRKACMVTIRGALALYFALHGRMPYDKRGGQQGLLMLLGYIDTVALPPWFPPVTDVLRARLTDGQYDYLNPSANDTVQLSTVIVAEKRPRRAGMTCILDAFGLVAWTDHHAGADGIVGLKLKSAGPIEVRGGDWGEDGPDRDH